MERWNGSDSDAVRSRNRWASRVLILPGSPFLFQEAGMKCYITGDECTCGGFDVVGDCPHDEFVHDEDFVEEDDDHSSYDVERRFAEMSEQI